MKTVKQQENIRERFRTDVKEALLTTAGENIKYSPEASKALAAMAQEAANQVVWRTLRHYRVSDRKR